MYFSCRFSCLWVWLVIACSCGSRKKEESLSNLPVYQSTNFHYAPGEKLKYKVALGLIHAGNISLEVAKECDTINGLVCVPITASAHTLSGIRWITRIKHDWHSWIDTGSGNTLKMMREARENGYRSREEVDFWSSPGWVIQKDLDEPAKTPVYTSAQGRVQNDFVNLIWKLRYTPFEDYPTGKVIEYGAYFDKAWHYFDVKYQGIIEVKWNGKKHKVYKLVPQGTAAKFLKGAEPARIYLEAGGTRRLLEIELRTYFGDVTLSLVSP